MPTTISFAALRAESAFSWSGHYPPSSVDRMHSYQFPFEIQVVEGDAVGLVVLIHHVADHFPTILSKCRHHFWKGWDFFIVLPTTDSFPINIKQVDFLSDATTLEVEADILVFKSLSHGSRDWH